MKAPLRLNLSDLGGVNDGLVKGTNPLAACRLDDSWEARSAKDCLEGLLLPQVGRGP